MSEPVLVNHPLEILAPQPDDGKEECPDCGGRYFPGPGMGVHRRAAHGQGKQTRRKACPECGELHSSKDMARHRRTHGVEPPKRGRPPKSPEWNVDDIFAATVSIMWPNGEIPVTAVMSLIRWREDTQRMLMEVQGR